MFEKICKGICLTSNVDERKANKWKHDAFIKFVLLLLGRGLMIEVLVYFIWIGEFAIAGFTSRAA